MCKNTCVLLVQVAFGEEHRIVGNVKALGEWDYHHAPKMRWNKGDVWTLQLDLPANEPVEFKVLSGLRGPVMQKPVYVWHLLKA